MINRSETMKAIRQTDKFMENWRASMSLLWEDEDYRQMMLEKSKLKPSLETRTKMSDAKLGVKKSEEHRKSMSNTQKRLHKVFKFIQEEEGLTYREAKKLYSTDKQKWKDLYES